jgi:hypothetical protein
MPMAASPLCVPGVAFHGNNAWAEKSAEVDGVSYVLCARSRRIDKRTEWVTDSPEPRSPAAQTLLSRASSASSAGLYTT